MTGGKLKFAAVLWGMSALAHAQPESLTSALAPRLSWGPYEYLEKGYRNAPWVSDPFYPEARGFELMGYISDEMAFINGQWFRLGEEVDGFTIKAIKPEGVTLTRRAELMLLKMRE